MDRHILYSATKYFVTLKNTTAKKKGGIALFYIVPCTGPRMAVTRLDTGLAVMITTWHSNLHCYVQRIAKW
jgi:hypothetical protein